MQTFMDTQKNALLRKFHTLLGRAGVDAESKEIMLAAYGVTTSKDLSVYELTELCGKLDKLANPDAHAADKWRKRVIAAIAAYLREVRHDCNMAVIKSIACRATKYDDFNKIPVERLRSVYNAFTQRTKDMKEVDKMTYELLSQPRTITGEA